MCVCVCVCVCVCSRDMKDGKLYLYATEYHRICSPCEPNLNYHQGTALFIAVSTSEYLNRFLSGLLEFE